jgi:hypothetical protein
MRLRSGAAGVRKTKMSGFFFFFPKDRKFTYYFARLLQQLRGINSSAPEKADGNEAHRRELLISPDFEHRYSFFPKTGMEHPGLKQQ